MSDLITVGATGIRAKLLENSQLADIVLDAASGLHKIFLYAAPGNLDVPYINMVHIWGGDKNETPRETFDMLWRVSAVVTDVPDGEDIASLIRGQLHRQRLPGCRGRGVPSPRTSTKLVSAIPSQAARNV